MADVSYAVVRADANLRRWALETWFRTADHRQALQTAAMSGDVVLTIDGTGQIINRQTPEETPPC